MATKNCFQLSTTTICTTTTSRRRASHVVFLPKFNNALKVSNVQSLRGSSTQKSLVVCKAKEALNEVQPVTEKGWEGQVIGNENPVMVEFWAPWCGPCRIIAPVIDELAREYAGKIACYKVNTDDCPNIATQYGIRSIPTVLFFKNGERKESIIGAVPKDTLVNTIEKYVDV